MRNPAERHGLPAAAHSEHRPLAHQLHPPPPLPRLSPLPRFPSIPAGPWPSPVEAGVGDSGPSGSPAVPSHLREVAVGPEEAGCPHGDDGHPISHLVPQAQLPALRHHADQADRERRRWHLHVAHCQAWHNPDVAWPHEAGLFRHVEEVLGLITRAVDDEDLGINLPQEPLRPGATPLLAHLKGEHLLQLPAEVAGVREGADDVQEDVVARVEAGDDSKGAPVIFLQHLEDHLDLLLNGDTQLQES